MATSVFGKVLMEDCFKGMYQQELPIDDKGMFILGTSLKVAEFCYKAVEGNLTVLERYERKYVHKTHDVVEKRRYSILKNAMNTMTKYVCEQKGFKKKKVSFEYMMWYRAMSKQYESHKEEWSTLIRAKAIEIVNLVDDIVEKEVFVG